MKKPTRVTTEDIRTLETIYADGRLLGRLVNDLKAELAAARAENATLKAQLRTAQYCLRRAVPNGASAACAPARGSATLTRDEARR